MLLLGNSAPIPFAPTHILIFSISLEAIFFTLECSVSFSFPFFILKEGTDSSHTASDYDEMLVSQQSWEVTHVLLDGPCTKALLLLIGIPASLKQAINDHQTSECSA